MSDDLIIAYLRSRGRMEPEPSLVARIMNAVDAAPPARSAFAAFLPAAAIAGAVAIVTALAIILAQGPNVGPPDPTRSADARPSSIGELRAALGSAWAVLREAPGVEGVGTTSILGELAGATWFSWRPNGDQIVIFRTDLDIAESGWWLQPEGEPRARGENVSTTIHVLVGDEYFMTDGDAWVVQARADAPPAFTIPTGLLDDAPGMSVMAGSNAGDEVTVASNPGGGTTWTLESPYRDGRVISEWQLAPDGGLVSESYELVDVSVTATLDFHPLASSGRTEFTRLPDAEPIVAPDTDAPPDAAALGLPPDFPLEAAAPAADVDYVEYVAVALDAMEAYHWNTASIDWDAARAAALDGLPGDPTAGQAHRRIIDAIQTFDTFNTTFVRPGAIPSGDAAPADSAGPSGERFGEVGYLDLPALDAGGPGDVLGYMEDGWAAMESIESSAPVCGWIVDVRETAHGAYPPLFGVVAGLLGDGRVITFDSAVGDWWVDVNDGRLELGGDERSADILDSPAVARVTAEERLRNAEFAAMLASAEPHLPADRDAPVVVLTSSITAAAGEQLVAGFRGRPATRVIGGVTAGSPHGQMSLEMVDGARLRIPVSTIVDRAGTVYDSNMVPDENVAVLAGPNGDDPTIDAALEWLQDQPTCG